MSDFKTSTLLAIALVVFNRKDIILFFDWLHFKLNVTYKQRANERKNDTIKRP
ncbi:hypothetical protein QWY99_08600 [Flavobacterium branchiarum]|uniref:Transposase n=1 Tax=Flavobacterium branchiarum TaxID=1114870 RepID=A0ABV5FPY1_9FLAO|nr:hypothetical protein [Flavobacterium branchiarum]MDN3673105.1 hypothetical protein [Flavobacterium branchiarum]